MVFHTQKKSTESLNNMLTTYIVIFFFWTLYRLFFRFPETVDECVAKPLLWIGPLLFLRKDVFRNTVKSLKITVSYSIIMGLSIGILYFAVYTLFSSFQLGLPVFNPTHFSLKGIYLQLIIALCTGFVEEIVFRRYFLEEALTIFNDRIIANTFIALLFTLIHLPIIIFVYHYSLASTISYLALLFISGCIYGLVYLHKKSVLSSSVTHAVWNFLGTVIR